MDAQWLGPVTQPVGTWSISYPDAEGMLSEDYAETLKLLPDGSFRWEPSPEWAASGGTWGVQIGADGRPSLCFRTGPLDSVCHVVVVEQIDEVGVFFHWQHAYADAVVLADRILRGYRVGDA